MKKIIALIMAFVLVFSTTIFATDVDHDAIENFIPQADQQAIIRTLQDMSIAKSDFGFDDINFSQIYIAPDVPVYTYNNGAFENVSFKMYPLFTNGALFSFAVVTYFENNQRTAQIYRYIADAVNDAGVQTGDAVFFLYDAQGFKLICNNVSTLLSETLENQLTEIYDLNNNVSDAMAISWNYESGLLGYSEPYSSYSTRASGYVSCTISSVSQQYPTYKNLCWAASVACIGNKLKSMSKTAYNVASAYNPESPDTAGYLSDATSALSKVYGVTYYKYTACPSDNRIISNVSSGYPVYGQFTGGSISHAVVIYGISATGGYITIMDPFKPATYTVYVAYDSANARYSYAYTSPYASNTTIYLRGHACYDPC